MFWNVPLLTLFYGIASYVVWGPAAFLGPAMILPIAVALSRQQSPQSTRPVS